MGMRFRFLELA
uniref:Uncharacterized protein n=1 Tax=Arundo donax TaxID=35708 RepID=A0A0A9FD24_ARUDO